MQDIDILSKELKKAVLDDESRLDEATKELKSSIEKSIEGDFKMEQWKDFMRDRKAIITGAVSPAKTRISKAKKEWEKVESREEEDDFQTDRRRNTISNKDYNRVKRAAEHFQFLYTHFTALFYAENRVNDKVVDIIDLQRSRSLQEQNLKLMKENLPQIINRSFDENDRINELEESVKEKNEKLRELEEELSEKKDLERRIELLENKVEASREPSQEKENDEENQETEEEEEIEDVSGLESCDLDKVIEEADLNDLQIEAVEIVRDEDVDLEELADELGRPERPVKQMVEGIINMAEEQNLENKQLLRLIEEE